jgi:hypothetical protein
MSEKVYLPYLSALLKRTTTAFDSLRQHMLEITQHSRLLIEDGKGDVLDAALLKNLVEANMKPSHRVQAINGW